MNTEQKRLNLVSEKICTEAGIAFLGDFSPKRSVDIKESAISVGFETLDRYHFDPVRTYPHLALLGAKWARVQTGWNRCEMKKGVYEFEWLDEVVDSLLEIGLQPFFNLGFGNLLYTPDAPHQSARGYVAEYYGQEALAAWQNYVKALAKHFRTRVSHWEIWNEPNTSGFWRPENSSPDDYVRLLERTVPLIREIIPDSTIMGGVFASCVPTHMLPFAEACFKSGMGKWIDKLTWHPYRSIPEHGFEEEVACLRRLLAKYAPDAELWQGECGCQSKRGGLCEFMDMESLDESVQAKWVLRRMLFDLHLGLEFTQYFHTVDLFDYIKHDGPSGQNQYMGLLRGEDYSPKPSFFALQTICSLFDKNTKTWDAISFFHRKGSNPGNHNLNPALIRQAAFKRDNSVIYAYWMPGDFDAPFSCEMIQAELWHGDETPWTNPVLIDPLGQKVFSLPKDGVNSSGGEFLLPLFDAPLFVCDGHMLEREGFIDGNIL